MHLEIKCNKCGDTEEKCIDRINLINTKQDEVSRSCSKCGSQDRQITEKDIVDLLEELSANIGSKMEVISSKTEEGAQLGSLGNIGALLRFKPSH
jgi:peptide chain release factor subunit 1